MKNVASCLLISLLLLLLLASAPVNAQRNVVKGVLNAGELLVVVDQAGNVLGVYPPEFYIEFVYSFSDYANETGAVTYRVVSKRWWWVYEPPSEVHVPELNTTIKLHYKVDLSVYTNSTQPINNETYTIGGVSLVLNVKMYAVLKGGPSTFGPIPIGNYILAGMPWGLLPEVGYEVVVEKICRVDSETYTTTAYYSDTVALDLSNIWITLYGLEFDVKEVKLVKYVDKGDLETGVTISPLYNITFCGNILHSSTASLGMIVSVGASEVVLTVDGDPEHECVEVGGVELVPAGNQSIVVNIRTGVFSLLINATRPVEGVIASTGRPSGLATGSEGTWNAVVAITFYVVGYYERWPTLVATASVYNQYFGMFSCTPLEIQGEGIYKIRCNSSLSAELSSSEILNSDFKVEVEYVDELGETHSFTGVATMSAFDPTNLAEFAWSVYQHAINVLLLGMIGIVIMLVVSMLKETITGIPLVDPMYLRGALLTVAVALTLLHVGLPIVYYSFGHLLSNVPMLSQYVSAPDTANSTESFPKVVFTHLIGYYSKLFEAIEIGYREYYVGSLDEIFRAIAGWATVAVILLGTAFALSFFFGAGIPFASIASTFLSIIFAFIGLALTVAPMGAVILVSIALGRLVIVMTTVVIIAIMVLGVILLCIPSPFSQRFGEEFFGAGILYFIVFPMLAPITYSLYRHVIATAMTSATGAVSASLGLVAILIPIAPIVKIMIYFVASGASILIVISSLAYILSRTGIATGIGEVLSGMLWRG